MSANNKVCGWPGRCARRFRITNDSRARTKFAATPQVLILGANGRVGLAVAQAFAASGWHVFAQVRRDAAAGMPSSATLVREPLTATAVLAAAAQGARVVVYAVNPAYTAWAREAFPGLRQGIAVASALGARLMFPGNVYNYGARMPGVLGVSWPAPNRVTCEPHSRPTTPACPQTGTPEAPTTRKGAIRVSMEQELAAAAAAATAGRPGGCRATVIRAGDFFGGGSGNWFDLALAKDLRAGVVTYPGRRLDVPHAWAFLPDLACTFVDVAALPEETAHGARPTLERLHFAGHVATGADMLEALEAAGNELGLGGGAPGHAAWKRASVPWLLMRIGSLCDPMLRELLEMRYLWDTPHALDGAALRAALGGRDPASTPFRVAVKEAVAALEASGEGPGAGASAPK